MATMTAAWGSAPGELAWKQPSHKLSFEVKFTYIVSIVLFYPLALSLLLNTKSSVRFWVGDWMLYVAAGVVAWVLLCHLALARGFLHRHLAPLVVLVLPALFLAGVCQMQAWQISGQGAALMSRDCRTFLEKADLDRAWWAARDIQTSCLRGVVEVTGADAEETRLSLDVRSCAGYTEARENFEREWLYLEGVEEEYQCGGWCTPQTPLWRPSRGVYDSCSASVGRSMSGHVGLLGSQVSAYSVALMVCSTLALFTGIS